jgi:MraZ protein
MFLSTHEFKIDKKKRLSMPTTYREQVRFSGLKGFILFRSPSYKCIEGVNIHMMKDLIRRLDHIDLFSETQDDLATTIFAEATECLFDGEGRILVPEKFLDYADIETDALVVGLGIKFQIWRPDYFEHRMQYARDAVKEKQLTLPHAPVHPSSSAGYKQK